MTREPAEQLYSRPFDMHGEAANEGRLEQGDHLLTVALHALGGSLERLTDA